MYSLIPNDKELMRIIVTLDLEPVIIHPINKHVTFDGYLSFSWGPGGSMS